MINRKRSAAVLRTSFAVVLIGLGLGAAVMEVRADLPPRETQHPAIRAQFDALWKAHVVAVDRALAQHDVSAAVGAWHDAYGAALASRGWEGMIAVGDAFLRLGAEAGTPGGSRPNARQAYLNALIRAHRDGSPDGIGGRPRRSRPWATTRWRPSASGSRMSWPPAGKGARR